MSAQRNDIGQTQDNIDRAWNKLIETAVKTKTQRTFNVTLLLRVNGETWKSYNADVSHRDILFYCDKGTCTYLVDSIGDKHTVELFDWNENE